MVAKVNFSKAKPETRLEARQRRRRERERFARARKAETWYGRALRQVAAQIDALVKSFDFEEEDAADRIVAILDRYETLLEPWAENVGKRMLAEVAQRDFKAWAELGRSLGVNLRREIETAPTGTTLREALARQVGLITSLPREAAQRVHNLTTEALYSGRRAAELADEIFATGEVTKNRANTIARTEVGRTATELTVARARFVGATHFQWVTAGDRDVRPLHKKLEGRVFEFDNPPIIGEKGERGLPGSIYNCRCTLMPIVPEHFFLEAA